MVVEICKDEMIVYYRFSKEEKEDKEFQSSLHSEQYEWLKKGYAVCDFLNGNEKYTKDMREKLIETTVRIFAIAESKNKHGRLTCSFQKYIHLRALDDGKNMGKAEMKHSKIILPDRFPPPYMTFMHFRDLPKTETEESNLPKIEMRKNALKCDYIQYRPIRGHMHEDDEKDEIKQQTS